MPIVFFLGFLAFGGILPAIVELQPDPPAQSTPYQDKDGPHYPKQAKNG